MKPEDYTPGRARTVVTCWPWGNHVLVVLGLSMIGFLVYRAATGGNNSDVGLAFAAVIGLMVAWPPLLVSLDERGGLRVRRLVWVQTIDANDVTSIRRLVTKLGSGQWYRGPYQVKARTWWSIRLGWSSVRVAELFDALVKQNPNIEYDGFDPPVWQMRSEGPQNF